MDSTASEFLSEQAQMGRLPLLPEMRPYQRWLPWLGAAFTYGAATWALMTGGYLGSLLAPPAAFAALLLGQGIALTLSVVFTGVICTRFGIDTIDAARPTFGVRGAQIVTLMVLTITVLSILVLVALTGSAVGLFLHLTLYFEGGRGAVGIVTAGIVSVSAAIAAGGPRVFSRIWNWFAPAMLVLVGVMLVALVAEFGFSGMWNAAPDPAFALPEREAFAVAVEASAGVGFAFWVSTGALFRLVATPRMAVQGSMIGWGILCVPVIGVAIFSAAVLGTDDPTSWMYELLGVGGGTLAIVFILLANLSSTVTMFYICAIASRQIPAAARLPIWLIMAVLAAPAAAASFWPEKVFEWYPTVLGYAGLVSAPVIAVLTVDYFLLRRERVDLLHMFTATPGTKYWYWGGVNPVAMLSVAAGVAVYLAQFNPVTGEHRLAFGWTTASAPAFLVAGALHYLLTRLIISPRGLGDYVPGATAHVEVSEGDVKL